MLILKVEKFHRYLGPKKGSSQNMGCVQGEQCKKKKIKFSKEINPHTWEVNEFIQKRSNNEGQNHRENFWKGN